MSGECEKCTEHTLECICAYKCEKCGLVLNCICSLLTPYEPLCRSQENAPKRRYDHRINSEDNMELKIIGDDKYFETEVIYDNVESPNVIYCQSMTFKIKPTKLLEELLELVEHHKNRGTLGR